MKEKKYDNLKELTKTKKEEILEEVQEICGNNICIACYKCNHTNKSTSPLKQTGGNKVCPLEKYNIKPNLKSLLQRLEDGEKLQTAEEEKDKLLKICENCDYSKFTIGKVINTNKLKYYCKDCPVYARKKAMDLAISKDYGNVLPI